MRIDAIRPMHIPEPSENFESDRVGQKSSFGSFLENSVSEVNEMMKTADEKTSDIALGRTENLHEAMISMEKADTALKLMMQVRNKAIEAYQEILRMPL